MAGAHRLTTGAGGGQLQTVERAATRSRDPLPAMPLDAR
jgi:hypothetical protein